MIEQEILTKNSSHNSAKFRQALEFFKQSFDEALQHNVGDKTISFEPDYIKLELVIDKNGIVTINGEKIDE